MANYVITSAEVKLIQGELRRAIANVAIAAGEAIKIDPSSGRAVLAGADALIAGMDGIALNSAAANQAVFYAPTGSDVQLSADDSIDVTSEPVFLSSTPGKLIPHTDIVVGVFAGTPTFVGFLFPANARRNIRLVMATAQSGFND
jgi:hypothetical protein